MGKAFTPAFNRMKNKATGTRPYFILAINWGGGISYYSNRSITVGPISAQGKILSISTLDFTAKSQNMGAVGQLSVTIDDGDGEFNSKLKLTRLEKKPAMLYQGFEGLTSKDLAVLFLGEITGPITWSEGSRDISFSITSRVEDSDVGYSPTPEDFNDLAPDAYNVPWPMCFGTVANVPAVRVRRQAVGLLASGLKIISDFAKYAPAGKQLTTAGIECHTLDTNTDEKDLIHLEERNPGDLTTFASHGAEQFDIVIDSVRFSGTYDAVNKIFKVSEANKPLFTNIALASRDGTDPDELAAIKAGYVTIGQFWLPNDDYDLTGLWLYFKTHPGYTNIYRCVAQHGRKCIVDSPMHDPKFGDIILPDAESRIEAVYAIGRSGNTNWSIEQFYAERKYKNEAQALAALRTDLIHKDEFMWNRPSGTDVRIYGTDPDVYVVSSVEMSSITSVRGKKKETLEVGKDLTLFKQLPSSKYTVQLQSNYPVGGGYSTAILLQTPIKLLDEGKWDETLYVSGVSTVGPNIADIIRYLLNRYTDLYIDNSSFADCATKTSGYPANFAHLDRDNVIKVCEDFAWQARCALIIDNNTAYLRFLAEAGTSVMVIDESQIKIKSLVFGCSNTDEVVTKLLGSWTPDYKDSPRQTKYNQARTRRTREIIRALTDDARVTENQTEFEIFQQNIDIFGTRTQEYKFNIYNQKSQVTKNLAFWGSRLSDIWQTATMTLFMPALHLQVFDPVKLDLPNFFNFQVDCRVLSVKYNPTTYEVDVELWLPIKAGGTTVAGDAYGT